MQYIYVRTDIQKMISEEEAKRILSEYYKDTSFIGNYQFRLKTPYGWIETLSDSGLTPYPAFFGVCGDWCSSEE